MDPAQAANANRARLHSSSIFSPSQDDKVKYHKKTFNIKDNMSDLLKQPNSMGPETLFVKPKPGPRPNEDDISGITDKAVSRKKLLHTPMKGMGEAPAKHPSDSTLGTYNKIFSSDSATLFKDPPTATSMDENKQVQKEAGEVPQAYSAVNKQAQNARDRGANMRSILSWDS